MAQSIFTYSVTKPYPFRWFTPVVIIGGIVATILFSLINLASSGYSLEVVYTSNPNATFSQVWFENWPSLLIEEVRPTCQSTEIPITTPIFTNNTALAWTLTGVSLNSTNGEQDFSPSLIYQNNVFGNCDLRSINILLDHRTERTASQIAISPWGAQLEGYVTCALDLPTGLTKVNLTAIYNMIPPAGTSNHFIGRNQTSSASLYWGESLLSMYWLATVTDMDNAVYTKIKANKTGITKGFVNFTPNNVSITDIHDPDYFNLTTRWIVDEPYNGVTVVYTEGEDHVPISERSRDGWYPDIWLSAANLAKVFYSTVLTDLGQISTRPNILIDEGLIQHWSANFSDILKFADEHGQNVDQVSPGPATKDFNSLKSETGPLGITPSTIATSYLCQVPRKKATSDLVISVLIADFIFLSATWSIFKFITDYYLDKKDPQVSFCEGCIRMHALESSRGAEKAFGVSNQTQESLRPLISDAADVARPGISREPSYGGFTDAEPTLTSRAPEREYELSNMSYRKPAYNRAL